MARNPRFHPLLVVPMLAVLLALPGRAITGGSGYGSDAKTDDTNAAWIAEHYTKYEHRIPMRDGVRLMTRVYVPKDDSKPWPILLTRTPYSLKPYGVDNFQSGSGSFAAFARDTFVMVSQDVRGRFGSEGEFDHMRPHRPVKGAKDIDESTDAWDTIDWLVKNVPNNNGRVGMFGISYPGFYTAAGMIDSHPALKAASPQAPITDWFMGDDLHHNGAFFLSQNFGFMYWFDQKSDDPLRDEGKRFVFGNPDGYDFYRRMGPLANSDAVHLKGRSPSWSEFLKHPTYDAYWQARNIRPHLKNVRCAVMTVGGWYDAEDLFGPLETYRWTERLNPGITNQLVMGPWSHGQWSHGEGAALGDVRHHVKTGAEYREKMELPFFRRYLKDDTNSVIAEATMFETGTDRWRRFDAWPPKSTVEKTLHLHRGGGLSFEAAAADDGAFDEYVSDPDKPVPFTLEVTTDYPRSYPVHDQRFAAARPDVLVYETGPLESDVTFAGPMEVTLNVSTTGTDSDWVVKLVDVYGPDHPEPQPNPAHLEMGGYQQLVRGDVFRGKFRKSFEKPEPFTPGKAETIRFTMPDVLHTFRTGHRIMVQVQSTWFPLVDRNPQTFVNIPTATAADYKKATQRVHLGAKQGTSIAVRVLPAVTP